MSRDNQKRKWNRRSFLGGAGLLGLGGAVSALGAGKPPAVASKAARLAEPRSAYDVERFRKTDPALVHYEAAARFASPWPEPKRLCFGPDGTLWLSAGKRVAALSAQGEPQREWSVGQDIRCLAAAPEGGIFLGLKDRIEIYDGRGQRLGRWEAPAKGAWLTSLAVGAKDVFAADAGNRIVHRLDRAGKVIGKIGQKDPGAGIPAFVVPSPYFDLELGPEGLLWVVNPGFHQFQAFTADGQLQQKWGEASFSLAGFCGCCNPSHFTRLADGRFVTSEKGLARVKVYSATGQFESVVAGPEEFPKYFENLSAPPIPVDVAADAGGRVYVADTLGNQVRVYRRKTAA